VKQAINFSAILPHSPLSYDLRLLNRSAWKFAALFLRNNGMAERAILTNVYDLHVSNQQFDREAGDVAVSANVARCIGAW